MNSTSGNKTSSAVRTDPSPTAGLFSGGVPFLFVANDGTSTSPGTSAPRPLDFLLRRAVPFPLLFFGSAPLSGGNGSVILRELADPPR